MTKVRYFTDSTANPASKPLVIPRSKARSALETPADCGAASCGAVLTYNFNKDQGLLAVRVLPGKEVMLHILHPDSAPLSLINLPTTLSISDRS